MAPGMPRPRFAFFESMYGLWKTNLCDDDDICRSVGPRWLQLFQQWKSEGLDAIHSQLGEVLDIRTDWDVEEE